MTIPMIMLAMRDPCKETEKQTKGQAEVEESAGVWFQEQHSNDSYRSEDHVQWHGNVKVESIIVDHAHSEEHGDHDPIVSGGKKKVMIHLSACRNQQRKWPQYLTQDSLLLP